MAHVYAARAVLPSMIERGQGYLLNTVSAAGLLSQIGSAPYSTTKHAAIGFAESLAITHGDDGIKVSLICPQAVRTNFIAGSEDGPQSVDGIIEPDDVAESAIQGLAEERFLILPHEQVKTYMQRKIMDYDRWLKGMRRFRQKILIYTVEDKSSTKREEGRFGDIALRERFVTSEQVLKSIEVQIAEDIGGQKHRFIGQILLELGYMSSSQVNDILKIMGILP